MGIVRSKFNFSFCNIINMKKTNLTFMEKHSLIESKTNEVLYRNPQVNKAFVRIIFSKDLNTRKNHLINLIKNIVLKFHLY